MIDVVGCDLFVVRGAHRIGNVIGGVGVGLVGECVEDRFVHCCSLLVLCF